MMTSVSPHPSVLSLIVRLEATLRSAVAMDLDQYFTYSTRLSCCTHTFRRESFICPTKGSTSRWGNIELMGGRLRALG